MDALTIGSIYALMALALALLFSVMRLINFAYGELLMIGGYTLFFLQGLPLALAAIIAVAVVLAASLAMDAGVFRPLRRASPETLLIASFAISFALQGLARMVVGARGRGLNLPERLTHVVHAGGVRVPLIQIVTAVVTIVMLVAVGLVLQRTLIGIRLRAAAEDFEMARLLGVRASRVISSAFAITGLMAGVVALLLVARTGSVFPEIGRAPLLIAFVAAVLGGLGSLWGAVLGGLFLGVVTGTLQALLPVQLGGYRVAFLFATVILVLVLRPQGLAGKELGERV